MDSQSNRTKQAVRASVQLMEDKYYILINSDQLGPYSAADLSGLLSDGVITRLTPLKSDDRDSWFTVGDVLPEPTSQSSSLGSLPAHAPKPPAPPAVPKPMPSPESLMVHVSRDGQQFGPYKYSELQGYLMTGELHPNDMAWHEGLAEWVNLRSLVNSKATNGPATSHPRAMGQTQTKSGTTSTATRYTVNTANRLYSPDQIGIAGFLGSPVAACWCISVNYRRLGSADDAMKWLVFAGVSSICVVLGALTPIAYLINFITNILLPFAFKAYASRNQGGAVTQHLSAGGRLTSGWLILGLSLVVYFLLVGGLLFLSLLFSPPQRP